MSWKTWALIGGILWLALCSLGCNPNWCVPLGLCVPNTSVTVRIVNDLPYGYATVHFFFTQNQPTFSVPIDANGKGSITWDTGLTNPGTATVQCANGGLINGGNAIALNPNSNSGVTVDCQSYAVAHDPASCRTLYNAMRRVDRIQPPVDDGTCDAYPPDFSNQANRTLLVTNFAGQSDTHQAEANLLYSWLLNTTPPDGTVVNNLNAGQSLESQAVYIAAGGAFYSAAGGTNTNFVKRAYHLLLGRDATTEELNDAVGLLTRHWVTDCCVCFDCVEPCNRCMYMMPRGEWISTYLVPSDEFYRVAGTVLLYGAHLSRAPSPTEISNLATQMDSAGFLQGGAIPVGSSAEFYQDSATEWFPQ
jgi:hypothetical protein